MCCIVLGREGKEREEMCANAFVDFSTAVASAEQKGQKRRFITTRVDETHRKRPDTKEEEEGGLPTPFFLLNVKEHSPII